MIRFEQAPRNQVPNCFGRDAQLPRGIFRLHRANYAN
jgi:hypothetical protein